MNKLKHISEFTGPALRRTAIRAIQYHLSIAGDFDAHPEARLESAQAAAQIFDTAVVNWLLEREAA